MSVSVFQHVSHTNDWVSCFWAFFAPFMECFLNGWYIFIWNILTFSCIHEYISHISIWVGDIFINWLNIPNDLSVLPSTSRLFLMQVIELSLSSDGLSIIDSWITNNKINIIFSFHPLAVNEEM
jgi:hypothetical protein